MIATTLNNFAYRFGRTLANLKRRFDRFEARMAGRFSFAGGPAVRAGFWMIRIAVVLVAVLCVLTVLWPFLLVLFIAKRAGEGTWTEEDEEDFLEQHALEGENDPFCLEKLANEQRKAEFIMFDGEPVSGYPDWDR